MVRADLPIRCLSSKGKAKRRGAKQCKGNAWPSIAMATHSSERQSLAKARLSDAEQRQGNAKRSNAKAMLGEAAHCKAKAKARPGRELLSKGQATHRGAQQRQRQAKQSRVEQWQSRAQRGTAKQKQITGKRMTAYYNEIDLKAAAWLRELIKRNLIAPGDVDERSIEDVKPNDLKGYTQCHFFAGIGVWSYALRQAGWSDDKPIWTGSCPCQPFSSAGKGQGFSDERHLWPAFCWLIGQRHPDTIVGEQVGGKNGETWFDYVSTDLERESYSCGATTFPACSIGSPHLRQRLYWVAEFEPLGRRRRSNGDTAGQSGALQVEGSSSPCGVANVISDGQHRDKSGPSIEERPSPRSEHAGKLPDGPKRRSSIIKLADDNSNRCDQKRECVTASRGDGVSGNSTVVKLADDDGLRCQGKCGSGEKGTPEHSKISGPAPTNGFWQDVDWLYCRDGKWRPVEPGTFPLAHGFAERVGLLRGFGNAIVAEQAIIFIEACTEILIK